MLKFLLYASLLTLALINGVNSFRCQKEGVFDNAQFFSCPGPQDSIDAKYCCGNKFTKFCCSDPNFGDDSWIGQRNENGEHELNLLLPKVTEFPMLSDSIAEKTSIVQGLAKLVGIIVGVALFVVVVCVVCCCCCPFCLLAKKRNRGQVIRTNTELAQQAAPPGAGYIVPPEQQQQQQPFLVQPAMPYPAQAISPVGQMAYPPAQGVAYPPGPYPQGAYPQGAYPQGPYQQGPYVVDNQMQPGYPMNPPPYPGLAAGPPTEYPPTEKTAYQSQPAYNPNY